MAAPGSAAAAAAWVAPLVMVLAVLALYVPPAALSGRVGLVGRDYYQVHMHRLRYAREALLGDSPRLPAWYPRELLGTPFWSNIQSLPLIPTRWPLWLVDPLHAYLAGVALAALAAAAFTYLFARNAGLAPIGAAVAGGTFAGAGFFASRVMAGHLPLLEAYAALPLLLWLIETVRQAPEDGGRWRTRLLGLGLATAAVALAGHPQLPAYAVGASLLYLVWRLRNRRGLAAAAAILLGLGTALVVWWPFLQLVGRSTRLLDLGDPSNDVALPWGRLGAFLFPWQDGWVEPVARQPAVPFDQYPSPAYFWDTVCYVGWFPLLAAAWLTIRLVFSRERRRSPWPFLLAVGVLALVAALPEVAAIGGGSSRTVLRSPARQLYLTTFALACCAGVATEAIRAALRPRGRLLAAGCVVVVVGAHAADLAHHARAFIATWPLPALADWRPDPAIVKAVGEGRVAIDYGVVSPLNRRLDDAGFFDSIMLARPYEAVLDLAGAPPDLNEQAFDAGLALSERALAGLGVKLVITRASRPDLVPVRSDAGLNVYAVRNPAPRVSFVPGGRVQLVSADALRARRRKPGYDLRDGLLLDSRYTALVPAAATADPAVRPQLAWRRPVAEEFHIEVHQASPGFVRCIESWDPGWTALVDGVPAPVVPADGFCLAVPVSGGQHQVRLRYRTPGATAGALAGLLCLALLGALAFARRRGGAATRRSTPVPSVP